MKIDRFEERAQEALKKCLAEVPFLELLESSIQKAMMPGVTPDFTLKVKLPKGQKTIIVEVKNSGQPRWIRAAVNQILRYKESLPNAYGVVVAPYISPTAAEICSQEGVGYVDLAGNCRFVFNQVYVHQEGRPNPFSEKRELQSLYSPKSSRILRVLLLNTKRRWKMQDLAQEADVSLGLVAKVKELLVEREWIQEARDGLQLVGPEALLLQWAAQYQIQKSNITSFYTLSDVSETEEQLSDFCRRQRVQFALTGFSAAARTAPFVRYKLVTAYFNANLEKVASQLNFKKVSSGATLNLMIPYDEGVFHQTEEVDGVPIVSSVQLYLDLKNMAGRGEEAAQFLLDEVIKPTWA